MSWPKISREIPGFLSHAEFAAAYNLPTSTVAYQMTHGKCQWPRKEVTGTKAKHYLYCTWKGMKNRCFNKNNQDFHSYGGRGIGVCSPWIISFDNFIADMGDRPEGTTLDRIDVNENYGPNNCRWATPSEQAANTRKTSIKRGCIYKSGEVYRGVITKHGARLYCGTYPTREMVQARIDFILSLTIKSKRINIDK